MATPSGLVELPGAAAPVPAWQVVVQVSNWLGAVANAPAVGLDERVGGGVGARRRGEGEAEEKREQGEDHAALRGVATPCWRFPYLVARSPAPVPSRQQP